MKKVIALLLTLVLTVSSTVAPLADDSPISSWRNSISQSLNEAGENVKDKAEDAGSAAKGALDSAKDAGENLKEKIGEKADEAGEAISEAASEAVGTAKEDISYAASGIKTFVSNIDPAEFKRGWNMVSKYVSASLGKALGQDYLQNVQSSITKLKENISGLAGRYHSNSNLASEAGFIAEQWHADTYNVNAAAAGSDSSAYRVDSNGLGSVDVATSWGEDYSLKYYKDGKSSAKAQAINVYQSYRDYAAKEIEKGNTPMSDAEYIDTRIDNSEITNLYDSLYKGEKRLIPDEQLSAAKEYLSNKVDKERVSNETRQQLSKTAQETLDNLAGRIENKKEGITSEPLTKKQAEAIAELANDGSFEPADFGIKPSEIIKPRYILKQAMGAGSSAAIFQAALSAGPDIYQIIVDAATSGDIDEEALKQTGIDAIMNGSEGFVEGSVSSAVLVAAQTGKLGESMTNLSPDTIGTLTVIMIDAVRYGYQMSSGEMTAIEYSDYMAEDIVVAIVSQSTGVALQTLLPMVPFAYMAGSMAGAMLASAGYTVIKEAVFKIQDSGGFAAIVPEGVSEGLDVGKEIISSIGVVPEQVSNVAGMAVNTAKSGIIKITKL